MDNESYNQLETLFELDVRQNRILEELEELDRKIQEVLNEARNIPDSAPRKPELESVA